MSKTLSFKDAKHQFSILLNSINDTEKEEFFFFIQQEVICNDSGFKENTQGINYSSIAILNIIANDIKEKLPINAILSSENIVPPTTGENADCLPDITVHVDEFLYDEKDVEELTENGKLKTNYCKDCGSKNIEPLIFTSHSMSRDALYFIFVTRLPVLQKKTVLDIGSRLGCVLYGAYVFTNALHIIGIEMNEDFCKLQNDIVCKYDMKDRIQILHKRVEDAADIVQTADVIILNNPFEFYVSEEEHIKIWQFLKCHIRNKAILITRPHLQKTLKNLNTGIILNDWVKPYNLGWEDTNNSYNEENLHYNVAFYEII